MSPFSVPTEEALPPTAPPPPLPSLRRQWALDVAAALVAAAVVYWLSCLSEPQLRDPTSFGVEWQQKSAAPWDLGGQFPHRLLAPLLAHLAGMGGEHWVTFTQATAVLLLVLVFLVARRHGARRLDAGLTVLGIGMTGAVQIYKGTLVGYVDTLGFSILLLAWLAVRSTLCFWPLILLGLVNHEMVLFFVPWLLLLRRRARASVGVDIVGAIVVLALYKAFRVYVADHASTWAYDGDYFVQHSFLPITFVWLWALAGVHLVTMFGPVLAVLVWHWCTRGAVRDRTQVLFIVGGFLAIFTIAYDVNRHSNMIAVPLVVASVRFLGTARSRLIYLGLIAATGLVSSSWLWRHSLDRLWTVMLHDLGGLALIEPGHRYDLQLHWQILNGTVAAVWPLLLQLAALSAAIVAFGWWLRRRGIGGSGEIARAAAATARAAAAAGVFHPPSAAPDRRQQRGPTAGT